MLTAKDAYITSIGIKIHLLILEDQKTSPVIIFVHASGFSAQHYMEFLILLNQRGFNVIGVDLEGHGKSGGKRGDFSFKEVVTNVYDTITYAIENYGSRVGIIGTSQGGIAVFYSLASDKRLKSGICHCAAIISERQSDGSKLKRFVLRSLYSLATDSPPEKIGDIKTPIMFIHPDNDGIFPMEYMRSLYDKLTCLKRFEVIPGMKHMFLEEHPGTAIDIVDKWFKETLK